MEPEVNEPEYSEPASIDDLEPGDDVDLDEENNRELKQRVDTTKRDR